MKKVIVGLFVCSLLSVSLCAQNVRFSAPVKSNVASNSVSILGKDNNVFYAVENHAQEQRIQLTRYSVNSLQAELTKSISYSGGISDMQFEQIIFLNKTFYLFSSTFDKNSEQLRIYCTVIDENGTVLNEQILVHHLLSEGRSNASQFGIATSPDNGKFMIYFNPPLERKLTEALSMRCYDLDLDILWEKEILLPYGSDIIQINQLLIDDETNLYLLSGRKDVGNFPKINKPDAGRHVLFFYNPKEHKLKEYDVTLKDKQITSIAIQLDKLNNIVICGYYSLDYKMNITGTYLYNITSKGGPVIAASFMPFNEAVTSKYKTENSKDILPEFYLKDVITAEDGNTYLIGEQRYKTEEIIYNQLSNSSIIETHFNFGDIVVSKLEANGRHIWNTVIPKSQYATSTDYTHYSFTHFMNGSDLLLFYNDNKDNAEKYKSNVNFKPESWSGSLNSITAKVAVNESGSLLYESLLSNKEPAALLNVSISQNPHDKDVLLIYSGSDNYTFCTLKKP